MDIPEFRAQLASKFYDHLHSATHPVFYRWTEADAAMPQIGGEPRGASGHPFQGENALQLMMASHEHGFTNHYWMTFDQAKSCGGSVKRGEEGTKVLSWIGREGNYSPILMTVFNGDQVQGVTWPAKSALTHEQQATRQAGLDALIAPRKKRPTLDQYVARLRVVLDERFSECKNEQARAQSALRLELALMNACARLGLPREPGMDIVESLQPFVVARPNWREITSAIEESSQALQDIGILPLAFDRLPRREIEPDVKPTNLPARSRSRNPASHEHDRALAFSDGIPF